jgi:hypothetical protein
MGRRKKQGITTPQKFDNISMEELVENDGSEYPIANPNRMINMSNKLNEDHAYCSAIHNSQAMETAKMPHYR